MTKTTLDLNADYPAPETEQRGLAGTLARLVERIERANDQQFDGTTLKHGLMVEVGIGEQFNLRISRPNVMPSLNEWRTVVRYLPDRYKPAVPLEPREVGRNGRRYLEACWDYQRRLL